MGDFGKFISGAVGLANTLGTSGSGSFDIAGRKISWQFSGTLAGFEWKYIGISVDSKTGETVTVMKQSRSGAVEHCIRDLIQRLQAKGQF